MHERSPLRARDALRGFLSASLLAVCAQGKSLGFGLEPVGFPIATRLSDGTWLDVVTEIVGEVQARVRPDGKIDVRRQDALLLTVTRVR